MRGSPAFAIAPYIVTPGNGTTVTNSVVTYTGTAEPGATVTVVVDGQTVGTVTAGADGSWSAPGAPTAARPVGRGLRRSLDVGR